MSTNAATMGIPDYEELLREIGPALSRLARMHATIEHPAEDLYAIAQTAAWKSRETYDAGRGASRQTHARNCAYSAILHAKRGRGKKNDQRLDLQYAGMLGEDWEDHKPLHSPSHESGVINRLGTIKLGPKESRLLALICQDDLTIMQMAGKIGSTFGATATMIHTLKRKFGARTTHGLVVKAMESVRLGIDK